MVATVSESKRGAGTQAPPRLRVLLLCDYDKTNAGTVVDHIEAFLEYSRHEYRVQSGRGDLLAGVDLEPFDAIVVHYSLVACHDSYLAPATRRRVRAFTGFKAAFVQDDYRFIDRTNDVLHYMGIHALFPLAGPDIVEAVYHRLKGVRKTTVLAGYVPEALAAREVPPYSERRLDVVYRARKLPAWMGSHTLQKWQISERFAADAERHGLRVDLSCREEDRIYGDAWIDFVSQSRAVLGTESGASVCDFTGTIQEQVERHLQEHPDTPFEVLRDRYFRDEDGRLMMNVISPRCFEAAALRTLMILYEGEYSGVLTPWRHYVPLRMDHSNMSEVVAVLRDPLRAQAIIDCAYREVVLSGRYNFKAMVEQVDTVFDECAAAPLAKRRAAGTTAAASAPVAVRDDRDAPVESGRLRALLGRLKRRFAPPVEPVGGRSITEAKRLLDLHGRGMAIPVPTLALAAELDRLSSYAGAAFEGDVLGALCAEAETLEVVIAGPEILRDLEGAALLPRDRLAASLGTTRAVITLNGDRWGLGTGSPFETRYPLIHLSLLARHAPGALRDLFGPGGLLGEIRVYAVHAPLGGDGSIGRFPVPLGARQPESKLRFYPGHGLGCAVDSREDTYTAAVEGQGLPQTVRFRFPMTVRVARVRLLWESAENLASDFTVRLLAEDRAVMTRRVEGSSRQEVILEVPLQTADAAELEIRAFHGQERLLMRAFEIDGVPA